MPERREIMPADQPLRRCVHRRMVEHTRQPPCLAAHQREVAAAVHDAIEIVSPYAENRASKFSGTFSADKTAIGCGT